MHIQTRLVQRVAWRTLLSILVGIPFLQILKMNNKERIYFLKCNNKHIYALKLELNDWIVGI